MKEKKNIKLKYILLLLLFIIIIFLGFCLYIYLQAPEFNTILLYKEESTNIYDSDNDLITTIGTEKRQLATYDELPEVLVDAIIATEDSRYFEHNGFDLPRFLKASIGQIKGYDAGGASTIAMQVSKNTFTNTDSEGIRGIIRKFTDIYLSIFKIDHNYSKKEILEFYVNSPYLGSRSYGVKQAALVYFNKNISDINLVEASLLAGLFQAPSKYDPFYNPDNANERKNTVLSLMLKHGYITTSEYNAAKKIDVKNILVENESNINPYQGFIDTVVQEVIDRTGDNPYEIPMDIYSTMVKSKQDSINEFYDTHDFKDDLVQVGIGVIDNKTGGIIAVGAGRNKKSELSLNYATQIKRHPGSTAKPIFDYGPGIEYNNWSTATIFVDKPVKYTNGGTIRNIDGKYQGALSLELCLIRSRNTCALQAFKKVNNSKINTFVTSLGITPEYLNENSNYINEAHAIGSFTGVSPVELAGAYAAFGNEGIFNEPHSYTKIVYKQSDYKNEVILDYETHRAMKDTTAYLIAYMLNKATSSKSKISNTDIATKTGTSSYSEEALKAKNLSSKVVQDSWTVTFSSDYSIAIWYGYDELYKDYYNTNSHSFSERTKIQSVIVKNIMEKGAKFKRPSGIISTTRSYGSDSNIKVYKGLMSK